jgi:hypothetical protein
MARVEKDRYLYHFNAAETFPIMLCLRFSKSLA